MTETETEGGVAMVETSPASIPFADAIRIWLKIGLLSFGGPAGQIALMHRILVEEKRWVDEGRFLHALNYCMLLPGPEAQQLATYIGWLLHKTKGGLAAGLLFVLPGALVMLGLSMLYAGYRDLALIEALFFGVKAAVLAVVIEAVIRIGRRALKGRFRLLLAASAFIAIFFLDAPFPLIVLGAGLVGFIGARLLPAVQTPGKADAVPDAMMPLTGRPAVLRASRIIAIAGLLWAAPIIAFALLTGPGTVYLAEGLFFSKMAVVTFGGAYAVLAYVAQQAVESHGWLAPGEMLDGLGLAETTPGPLIMVVQFVGFMGAYRHPGGLDPMLAGTLGALLTTWVTFTPCFLWIFLGAPYVEALRGNVRLAAALSAITAAVAGVILNLAVWFALHVLFGSVNERHFGPLRLYAPDVGTLDALAFVLAVAALIAMLRFKVGMLATLGFAAVAGVVLH